MTNTQNLEILEKFKFKCVRCRRSTLTVHEIIPRSQLKDWSRYGNQIPLCILCHEWAHYIGTKKSRPILEKFRDKRLLEYGLIIKDISSFVSEQDKMLSENYSRVLIMSESTWSWIKETLLSQEKTISDLKYSLDIEMDKDSDIQDK